MVDRKCDLGDRLLDYAVRIVKVVAALPRGQAGRHFGDQLLRSGTAPGAHYQEARAAESKNDFVHKLQIALKEERESLYWLRLLARTSLVPGSRLRTLLEEAEELRAILSKSVATAKGKNK